MEGSASLLLLVSLISLAPSSQRSDDDCKCNYDCRSCTESDGRCLWITEKRIYAMFQIENPKATSVNFICVHDPRVAGDYHGIAQYYHLETNPSQCSRFDSIHNNVCAMHDEMETCIEKVGCAWDREFNICANKEPHQSHPNEERFLHALQQTPTQNGQNVTRAENPDIEEEFVEMQETLDTFKQRHDNEDEAYKTASGDYDEEENSRIIVGPSNGSAGSYGSQPKDKLHQSLQTEMIVAPNQTGATKKKYETYETVEGYGAKTKQDKRVMVKRDDAKDKNIWERKGDSLIYVILCVGLFCAFAMIAIMIVCKTKCCKNKEDRPTDLIHQIDLHKAQREKLEQGKRSIDTIMSTV